MQHMREFGIVHSSLPINQAQVFLKKVAEIAKINRDELPTESLRFLKGEIAKIDLRSSYLEYQKSKDDQFQKDVNQAVSGNRHKKFVAELQDREKVEKGKRPMQRLNKNSDKFFYERGETAANIYKYSDYSNDVVMADILKHMLVVDTKPANRKNFLNNANMDTGSKALKRLLHGVEMEMGSIQTEKDRYSAVTGILPEDLKDDRRHFKNVLKKSRFKKTLLSSSAPHSSPEMRADHLVRLDEKLASMRNGWTQRR